MPLELSILDASVQLGRTSWWRAVGHARRFADARFGFFASAATSSLAAVGVGFGRLMRERHARGGKPNRLRLSAGAGSHLSIAFPTAIP